MKPGAVKWGGCEHLPRGLRLTWVQEKTSEEAARERRFTGRGATTGPAPLLPCQEAREANERVSAGTLCDEMSGWTATRWERKQKKRIGMCGKQRAPAASHAASVPCSCQALVGNAFLTGGWGPDSGAHRGERRASQEGDGVCLIFRPNAHVIRSASAHFVLFRVAATVGATKGSRLGEVTRHRERRAGWTKTKKAEITQTERGGRERRISSQHGRSQRASGKRTRFLEAQEGIQ